MANKVTRRNLYRKYYAIMKLNERDIQSAMHEWSINSKSRIDETGWDLAFAVGVYADQELEAVCAETDLSPVHALAVVMMKVMVLAFELGTFVSFEEALVFSHMHRDSLNEDIALAGLLKAVANFIVNQSQMQLSLPTREAFNRTEIQAMMNHLFILASFKQLHPIMNVLMPYWTNLME